MGQPCALRKLYAISAPFMDESLMGQPHEENKLCKMCCFFESTMVLRLFWISKGHNERESSGFEMRRTEEE